MKFYRIKTWDIMTETQTSAGCRFIENNKVIKINEIIEYTEWICAMHRTLKSGVKQQP
jgi:hypothetical protein